MFTYYQAENSTAEPALVNAIEQGLRAEHGVVTEDDILMELTKWVEASDNDILSDIYQQTIIMWSVASTLRFKVLCLIGNLI